MITLETQAPAAAGAAKLRAVRTATAGGVRLALIGAAFFKRDLLTDLSYRLSFLLHGFHILVGVAAYSFLARFVDRAALDGAAPFPFLLVGLAVNAYMSAWLVCFSDAIRTGQTTGTLKLVIASPLSGAQFLMFSALYPSARAAGEAGVYVFGGWALAASIPGADFAAAAAIVVLSSLAFAALGIGSASVALLIKRGDPVLWAVTSLSTMLGGVLYPIQLLPDWLQNVARLLPITHAVSGMRLALLGDGAIAGAAAPLALFVIIGLPLSLVGFGAAVRHARARGALGHV